MVNWIKCFVIYASIVESFSCVLTGNNFPPTFLGEYFRTDEFADQSQENLSSSSLRRKLFLEENGSVSECLSPPLHNPCGSQPLGVLCSIDISPVRCRSPLETSSSVSSLLGDGWDVT